MNRIQLLDKELVNLIAAGEVVERPASVIKELIENSIDAQSTLITIHLQESGKKNITIKDNGLGIYPEDIPLAFTQHATSKIKSLIDLESIHSFGFRGEALASINAVSESVRVESKVQTNNATHLLFSGEQNSVELATRTEQGTEISITNLFKRTPARLKFLKSDATELKHCIDTFLQVAIPHLHIHFELYHNGQLLHKISKSNSLEDRIFEIWGKSIVQNSYKVKTTQEPEDDQTADQLHALSTQGLIGNTFTGKKRNSIQYIYLNNRYIQSKIIASAIKQAYTGFLHRDLQPSYVLMLNIDSSKVDVNVHPRKLEVKFDNEQAMFKYIYRVIRKTLEKETKQISKDIELQEPIETVKAFDDFLHSYDKKEKSYTHRSTTPKEQTISRSTKRIASALDFTEEFLKQTDYIQDIGKNTYQEQLHHESIVPWQLFNTYILYEQNNELVVVDQHAAAEKILFEKLLETYGNAQTKPLLIPQIISYSNASEKNVVLEHEQDYKDIGIELSDFGGNDIQVTDIPELVDNNRIQDFLNTVLNPSEEDTAIRIQKNELEFYNITENVYLRIATAACHGSIRAGQPLNKQEMLHIIKQLPTIKYPFNCPHGRPTYWKVSKYEFAKVFNRNL